MKSQFVWKAGGVFIVLTAIASSAVAQAKPKHIDIPTIAAKAEDVSSPEAIVKADLDSISGGVGVPRQWSRDLSLYAADAHWFMPHKDAKTGDITILSATEQEFADMVDAQFVKDGFTEHEIAHKTYRFGHVATVLSSYEGKFASSGKIDSRGVNIYQVAFDGKRWWITSVSWDGVKDVNEIPPELLPAK
jgi:hypothetical protein